MGKIDRAVQQADVSAMVASASVAVGLLADADALQVKIGVGVQPCFWLLRAQVGDHLVDWLVRWEPEHAEYQAQAVESATALDAKAGLGQGASNAARLGTHLVRHRGGCPRSPPRVPIPGVVAGDDPSGCPRMRISALHHRWRHRYRLVDTSRLPGTNLHRSVEDSRCCPATVVGRREVPLSAEGRRVLDSLEVKDGY